jgi:phytoene desaturase
MTRAIVIGGGIAGLASAALLARDGYEVTLLEKNDAFGGRAGSWEHDGFRFDTGPSWYLMPTVFEHFFRLLGTTAEEQLELVQLDPGYRVFGEGYDAPLDVAADGAENIALFESVERGAGVKLREYLDDALEIYQLAVQKFLYSTFEKMSPVFTRDVIVKGLKLSSLLLTPLSRLTARTVKDRRLRQILGYPAVFLGSSPDRAPSMYSLMSHLDLVEGVLYPMGGFTRVIDAIEALAIAEGAELRSGVTVRRIVVQNGAACGVEVEGAAGTVSLLEADIVVSTADLHHSETVLLTDESDRTYPQKYWDTRVAGPSALLLYLGVSGELPELEHHSLFFSADWKRNFDAIFGADPHVPEAPSLYVCKPSGVDPEVAPDGSENVFVLVPLPADPGLGHGGVDRGGDDAIEGLADSVIAQIASAAGIPDLAERITVRRTVGPADFVDQLNSWKGSALGPAHTLRQSAFFRAGNVSKKVAGLYFAGSSTIPGIGLPMCLISAELVIKRLRGDISAGPLPEPLQATR